MEEDNDLEHVTGSPTAGENGFVHVESVDSAQMEGGSINQVERLEQDDGVVVTGVDAVQDEPHDARTTEDGGHDEFVDCPDDLVPSDARSPGAGSSAHQQPFGDDTENIQHKVSENEREIFSQDYEEEKNALMKEVSDLHHQLKALSKQQLPVDGNDAGFSSVQLTPEESGEKPLSPLRKMVNECSKFIELSMNERLQAESTIGELYATLHMKDKEIEDLIMRVNEHSTSLDEEKVRSDELSSFEATTDRILSSLAIAFGDAELSDTSVSGKLSYLEKSTSFLLEKYHYFLSEIQMLAHCLVEVKSDFQMQNGMDTVFPSVREELIGLKRKELELNDKNSILAHQHGQLMEQLDKSRETVEMLNAEIGKLKGEVEQEKTRYNNTKEKLSMAVTKGKALVQQRDSLKQMVAEKTSELERCLIELQEKSAALEAAELRNGELNQSEILANSLQEALSQRDMVLQRCAEILSRGLPEVTGYPDLESQVSWLLESYNLAKNQYIKLQDENNATIEAARAQIDHLTASLLAESQEKYRLQDELEGMTCKYEEIVEEKKHMGAITEPSPMDIEVFEKIQNLFYVSDLESKIYTQILELELDNRSNELIKVSEELHWLKDERNSLQLNLQRSEEKASLLREKLSMAVKKGKGLVQERENMKQQMAEKNTQIEVLMTNFQKQESMVSDCRDQITKLESERDQIGQFLSQSNTMLQELVVTIDSILLPVDIKEPVEKVKCFATYLSECQVAKAQAEQELREVKDEAGQVVNKLTEALTTVKSLEDALFASEKNVSQLSHEKREFEIVKTRAEQEVEILKEEIGTLNNKLMETLKTLKSLEDKISGSEKAISLLTEEKSELEIGKYHVEEALSLAENKITVLMSEKEEAQVSKVAAEMELQKVKEESFAHVSNLDEATKTIKSLEEANFQLNTNFSKFSQENEKADVSRTVLESEKLKVESEHEISTLKAEMSRCRQELAAKNDKWSSELLGLFGNLKAVLKDESLLSLFKQSFKEKIENLKEIDRLLKDMKDNCDSELLQDHPALMESFRSLTFFPADFHNDWKTGMDDDEFNAEDAEGLGSYVGKTLDGLKTKNQILANQFESFSTLVDDMIASLLEKLKALRNTIPSMVQKTTALQQNVTNLQMEKQMQDNKVVTLEHGINVLLSACADVTNDFKFLFENNMPQTDSAIKLETLNPDEETVADVKAVADELFLAARNVQSVMEQNVSVKENMSMTIKHLQAELEKTSSMHEKSTEVIEELQGELAKTRSMYDKVLQENDAFQSRVFKLETELEASGNTCNEMSSKLEDYRAKEEKLNESKRELSAQSISSIKDREGGAENALLSASQINTILDKIDGITIPFPNLVVGDTQPQDSDPVTKIFYVIDSVNELLDQLTLLTHAKEEMRSTLSKQALELDLLNGEVKDGLQNIIQKLGGEDSIGVKKPADVAGLLLLLERLVQGTVLDCENSRSRAQNLGAKLLETQKEAEELSSKVKLLEDFIQNRIGAPDTLQKVPSLPAGSEISEIDDQVPVGKAGLPLVPSAAQMRSLRKGSNDQLAITIDSESDRLLDKAETVEDKGHIFKSLHTSGLVPVRGKMIADRLDGIWVSGGQALMRRPRARLGLIAYWLVLHLWLLGTIL